MFSTVTALAAPLTNDRAEMLDVVGAEMLHVALPVHGAALKLCEPFTYDIDPMTLY